MMSFTVHTAPTKNSKRWVQSTVTWDEMREWMENPSDHKECGGYILGALDGQRREKDAVINRNCLTLDADSADNDFFEDFQLLWPYAGFIHSTYSHTPSSPRYRIIAPFSRPVTSFESVALHKYFIKFLGADNMDATASDANRFMYKPATQDPDWYEWAEVDGEPIDVDEILKKIPLSDRLPQPTKSKKDPKTLDGVMGEFNRAYTPGEAIIAFELPYEQVTADRWTYIHGTTPEGLHAVSDDLVYSHNYTDPAGMQTCSAFDLVRLHKFGELDEGIPEGTPISERPSQLAMLEFANGDKRVARSRFDEIVEVQKTMDDPEPATDANWVNDLTRNARTGKINDCIENWDLIVTNDPVFQSLRFNELTFMVEASADLPWRPLSRGGATFGSADRFALSQHLERVYGLRSPQGYVDAQVDVKARKRFFNPVREYLEGLVWDGVSRVEECLPGVLPTAYTRMVARKALVAAVARVFDPGCKWDHTLILFGKEARGKSYWIDKMSRGWTATLGRITDKDTLLVMQRSWIMVADEGNSMRKADADALKEFLTRREDVFRLPYERETDAHPRHCVIWGTTNDEVFLRRQEGNRRFLIVHSVDKVDFDAMTDDYIDQLWAEAVHMYHNGERLYLTEEESDMAAEERERYTEEDALRGLIEAYLETLVPEDWEDLSIDERIVWLQSEGFRAEGTMRIERVCSAQIATEALGRRAGEGRKIDYLEINTAMRNIPGWVALPKREVIGPYGPQQIFVRTDDLL